MADHELNFNLSGSGTPLESYTEDGIGFSLHPGFGTVKYVGASGSSPNIRVVSAPGDGWADVGWSDFEDPDHVYIEMTITVEAFTTYFRAIWGNDDEGVYWEYNDGSKTLKLYDFETNTQLSSYSVDLKDQWLQEIGFLIDGLTATISLNGTPRGTFTREDDYEDRASHALSIRNIGSNPNAGGAKVYQMVLQDVEAGPPPPPPPATPTNLQVDPDETITANSVPLKWDHSGAEPAQFIAQASQLVGFATWIEQIFEAGEQRSGSFGLMQPETNYYFRIKARDFNGETPVDSAWSDPPLGPITTAAIGSGGGAVIQVASSTQVSAHALMLKGLL